MIKTFVIYLFLPFVIKFEQGLASNDTDLCQLCKCDYRHHKVICSDLAAINYLPDIVISANISVTNLSFIFESSTSLILPWMRLSGLSSITTLNLASTKLSCHCENSWLSFLSDMSKASFNLSLIPDDMKKYYDSKQCDHISCPNFSTLAILNLPKNIILPRDPFKMCRSLAGKRITLKDYFISKCGLRSISLQANIVPALKTNGTLNATCTIMMDNKPDTNPRCVSMKFSSTFKEAFNVTAFKTGSRKECALRNGFSHQFQIVTSVTNYLNEWLICSNINNYLPEVVISPVYVATAPKLDLQKKYADNYYSLVMLFSLHGYPEPNIELISVTNPRIVSSAKEQKKLHIVKTQSQTTGGFNVLIQFKEILMTCISGQYKLNACNGLGCDSYYFSVGSGIPKVMCRDYAEYDHDSSNSTEDGEEEEPEPTTIADKPFDSLHNRDSWVYIVVPFIVVFAVVLVGVLTTCFFLRMVSWSRNKLNSGRPNRNRPSLMDWELSPLTNPQCRLDPNLTYVDWLESIKTKVRVFPSEQLEVAKELGEGAFGRVYLAHYKELDSNANKYMVENYANLGQTEQSYAMKVLKFVTTEKLEDLEREVQIMSSLDHPNVVKFFGISFKSGTLALLFECMKHGDLVNYLRTNSVDNPKCESPLKCNDFLNMATQVARGLEYLAAQHLVHRDLAARNCLVGKDLTVKISDFGMTRDIYITDYYKMGTHTLVPLRWLPPESIIYRKFTSESDIWSFGILLWEIFTYGKIPWYMHSNCEVLQIIQDGKLLDQPSGCPDDAYTLMTSCWSKIPSDRVTASQALKKLEEILENRLRYCNLLENDSDHSLEKFVPK